MGSKAETATMMSDWLTPNSKQVKQTKKELKRKGIKSPDLTKKRYRITDERTRTVHYFSKKEAYLNCFNRLTADRLSSEFKLSHPRLCKTTISDPET